MERLRNFFHRFFIPREDNNFRAKSLHPDFLGLYLIFALVISFAVKQIGLTNILGFATDISSGKLYSLVNSVRESNGLSDLQLNDKLSAAAYSKAQDMFAKNYWAHYSPAGATPWDFIIGTGYNYEFAGENLAKNFLFSQGVVDAWMNSPTHRDNILKSEYTEVGYAVVNGILNGEQTTLVVQMFGKPVNTPVVAVAAEEPVPEIKLNKPVQAEEPVHPVPKPEPVILSGKSNDKAVTLPKFNFNMNVVFFSFLLLALGFDFYFASKMNVIRVSGKNLAHFIFIFFALIGLLIIRNGVIL